MGSIKRSFFLFEVPIGFALVAAVIMGLSSLASAEVGGPTLVLSSTSSATTNAASIPVTATFSESVSGFASTSIVATNATVSGFAGSGASYSFNLDPIVDGTTTVSVGADVATATESPNKGNQASNTLTFTSDQTLPVISNVVVLSTGSSATITWDTNEPANGQVSYGATASYTASSTLETSLGTMHTATLTGLSAGTTYHFQIQSIDAAGNAAVTSDATFVTIAVPVISNVSASATGTSTAIVTWNTDLAATGQVFYGTSASYGSSTTIDLVASTMHSVALGNLAEATLYHYQVVSTGVAGTATSSDQVFTTDSTPSSTPLAVTGVDSVSSTATADGTFAHGFKWVLHFVVPSNETSFQMKFSDFTTPSSSGTIPVASNVRYYSSQSSNATSEGSAIVETNNNYGGALTLTGDASLTTPGRQIDVTVETAVPTGTPTGVYSTIFGALSTTTP